MRPVLWIRIRKFSGLLDPDPSLFVQIRIWLRILPSSSKNKVRKTLIYSVLWLLLDFLSLKMMYGKCTFKKYDFPSLKNDEKISLKSTVPNIQNSVPDPNLDPDPHVFGPPGSGSTSQRYGSGSFYHQAKIVRKTLIPIVLWLLLDFLSLKMSQCTFKK